MDRTCLGSAAFLTALAAIATALGCTKVNRDGEPWGIVGSVVDEQGEPINDFVAASLWSSNGDTWYQDGYWRLEDGNPVKLDGLNDLPLIWKDEGVLRPYPYLVVQRLPGGRFRATTKQRFGSAIFAVDADQRRGGFATARHGSEDPLTITLKPLARVTGEIFCEQAERTPDWTMAVVHAPGDAHNEWLIARCGSLKGEFSFLLPPGRYDLDVYSTGPDAHMPKPSERKSNDALADMPSYLGGIRIEVADGQSELDLGVLNVGYPQGRGDYSALYGNEPPPFDITDARGISKDVKLTDFRGKWVLLEFWSPTCGPCIARGLPQLTKLYEEHAQERDRFEIISICVTKDSNLRTVAEFEPFYRDLVEKSWKGKELPFPVLVDGEGKTLAAYGIEGFPAELLVDPAGHLVRSGSAALLVEKLNEK
ncbi:MAG TPA: TlpA disulfide reductase family protein [Planctomycetaceae bacterium]|jgi:thiol-disulfide isomerase/thioredoxin